MILVRRILICLLGQCLHLEIAMISSVAQAILLGCLIASVCFASIHCFLRTHISFEGDDWVTVSLCAEEGQEMTLWIANIPYEPMVFELSVTSNGRF
jgi:hypothetical protein